MASLLPVHIDPEEIQRQSFYLSQTRYEPKHCHHYGNHSFVGNKDEIVTITSVASLDQAHHDVLNWECKMNMPGKLSDKTFFLWISRMDSDIEEKRQNAIEQVWDSNHIV